MDLSSKKISSSVNQQNTSGKQNRTVGRIADYGSKAPLQKLNEGEIIKGEITDLRNSEVTVMLEDSTKVTGRLEHVDWLSIGDIASFKVTQILPGKINLQAIPLSESAIENNTMFKALEEAGLPHNRRNQSIVLSLIKNQLPITKQSIVNILKQSYELKEASISTIVLLNKYNIPATHANASQFENYISNEHWIGTDLQECINSTTQMLREFMLYSGENLKENSNSLLSVINEYSLIHSNKQDNPLNMVYHFPTEASKEELLSILGNFDLSEEMETSIKIGDVTLQTLNNIIESCYQNASALDEHNQNEVLNTLTDEQLSDPILKEKALSDIPHITDAFDNEIISAIHTAYEEILLKTQSSGSLFTPEQRQYFADFLNSGTDNNLDPIQVLNGQATIHEIMTAIQTTINSAPLENIQALFQSDQFALLLMNELSSQWQPNIEQLKQKKELNHYYSKLSIQGEKLSSLMNGIIPEFTEAGFGENLTSVQNNIQFMQILNQIFPYIQLPFQINGKPCHGELYVYTKKKNLDRSPKKISVLLHLSLESLGKLDIHITMDHLSLTNQFYIDDNQSKKLLKKNMELLETPLQNLGYHVTTEYLKTEQNVDIVKDFIAQKEASVAIKRYSFDIRA